MFASSNTYRVLHSIYGELGLFGTACSMVLPDFENVIHHYPLTIGEYALATNAQGAVDTVVREFQMTVEQMVEQFGLEACSASVRNLYTNGSYSAWIDVLHIVQPRRASVISTSATRVTCSTNRSTWSRDAATQASNS